MGQKVHPKKIRKNFSDSYFISNWFSDSTIYSKLLDHDLFIVNFIESKFKSKSILLNRFEIK